MNNSHAILRINKKGYGLKKYSYFPKDEECIEFETDSKEEMMIWLNLRGLKIGKKTTFYNKYLNGIEDYIVRGSI